ncbi:MAG: N-formylglutamate amidohydrolase [Chromatiales bacterium]
MWTIEFETPNLVSSHRGTLPVILSCPHEGTRKPEKVPMRTGKEIPSDCHFNNEGDSHTREITTGVAQRMLDIFGEAPYVVIAEYHRKYIDANRPDLPQTPNCAYEVGAAQPFYDEYHNTLRNFVNEIRAENGGLGLLFDIHGTQPIGGDEADLYLGTDNGNTVARLLKADPQALFRRRSLRGFLEAAGYVVSPEPGKSENPAVEGGHTVRTYGSSHEDGLDAIQIEIVSTLRNDAQKRADLIETLAYAIDNLVTRYADIHTLAAFQSIHLLSGDVIPIVSGQLQRRPEANDCLLQLGGQFQNRGRVEIRHDPGATSQPAPRRAGVLVLYGENGNDYYLWVDKQGKLRISSSDPGASSQAGTVIGTQT